MKYLKICLPYLLFFYSSANFCQTVTKKDSTQLLIDLQKLTLEDYKKFNLVELSFLKNAVFSVKGYKYAEDRPWLSNYFLGYGETEATNICKDGDDIESCKMVIGCDVNCKIVNLTQYKFPQVSAVPNFVLTKEIIHIFAKIRQAQLEKVRSLKTVDSIQAEIKRLDSIYEKSVLRLSGPMDDINVYSILGRAMWNHFDQFLISLSRDLTGDLGFLQLVEQFKLDKYEFDQAEILGLYLGNIDLLRKVILARSGREFAEPLKSDLAFLGVQSAKMSIGNLSPNAKKALERLDNAVKKLTQGQMNDLPDSMKVKALEIENESLSYSGAM